MIMKLMTFHLQIQLTRALHNEFPKMKTLTGGWLLYKAAGNAFLFCF